METTMIILFNSIHPDRIRSELLFTSSEEEEWPVLIEGLVRDVNRKRSLRAERSSSGDKGSEKRDKREIFNL